MLTQWFEPEPMYKGLAFAKALKARGHEVEVLTGFPNYPGGKVYDGYRVRLRQREVMDGIPVTRGYLYPSHDRSAIRRTLNYGSFAVSTAILSLALRRPDVVYVYSPPMTAAAAAVTMRLLRGVPFVIDVQDLWPDTLAATGMVNSPGLLRAVGLWTNFVFRRAAEIVVLSPGFKERLEARRVARPITVVPNWAPDEIAGTTSAPASEMSRPADRFNVLFAGNMGRAQALETVLAAASALRDQAPDVTFTLIGGGVEREALEAKAAADGLGNVRFLPARHPRDMASVFAEADALLVHLRQDPLFAITIPSKTQAYLKVGKPILMGVTGDAAAMVEAAGAGLPFTPEDPDALVAAVKAMLNMSAEERAALGRAGAAYYDRELAFDKGVNSIESVLERAARRR